MSREAIAGNVVGGFAPLVEWPFLNAYSPMEATKAYDAPIEAS